MEVGERAESYRDSNAEQRRHEEIKMGREGLSASKWQIGSWGNWQGTSKQEYNRECG